MTRVLVVASGARGRNRLARLLRAAGLSVTVEQAASRGSLDALIDRRRPDVVVLEPGTEAQLAVPVLLAPAPARETTPFVMLVDDLAGEAATVLRAGARAVLRRDATAAEIVAAVHAVAAGLATLPADLARTLFHPPSSDTVPPPADARSPALTAREAEILGLLGDGLGNKAIGVRLGISDHTVKTHLAAIYEKLGAANRAEAVATGLRRGLLLL